MITSIAWKNVWRNKFRSSIVITAVLIGLLAGSFSVSMMNGMSIQRTRTILENEISHIQIHNPKFEENNEIEYFISNSDSVKDILSKNPNVKAFSERIRISAMASSSRANTGVTLIGINPEQEKKVSGIYKYITDSSGTYFEDNKKGIVIGEELAKKLLLDKYMISNNSIKAFSNVFSKEETEKISTLKDIEFRTKKSFLDTLKSLFSPEFVENHEYLIKSKTVFFKNNLKIRISFQNQTGQLIENLYKVSGLYETDNSNFDMNNVFIDKEELIKHAGFNQNQIHEIAVLLNDKDLAEIAKTELKQNIKTSEISTWREINPELVMMSDYMIFYNMIIIVLILAALSFGIINTMLMAILDRIKELGMLAAVGMNRKKVFLMIMTETIFLTCVGAIVGLILNFGILSYYGIHGIDFSAQLGEGMEAIGYATVVYPEMGLEYYILITFLVIVTAILSSIYPALKAIRLKPADAVRMDN